MLRFCAGMVFGEFCFVTFSHAPVPDAGVVLTIVMETQALLQKWGYCYVHNVKNNALARMDTTLLKVTKKTGIQLERRIERPSQQVQSAGL